MKSFFSTYLTNWFFVLLGGIVLLYAISFAIPSLGTIANISLVVLGGITLLDWLLVFSSKIPLAYSRELQARMNLGDENHVQLTIKNNTWQPIRFQLIEGFPIEKQDRATIYKGFLLINHSKQIDYQFKPTNRGKFEFQHPYFIIASTFGLVSRRFEVESKVEVEVFPSVLQMKKYELLVFHQQKTSQGIKKIRRIGNNSEFEQIKNYVQGDEIKKVNWKATSRRFELMVNQYQEEKSQHVYCIIDKSRNMQIEFEGMSLLDHSINSTLAFSNVALRNGDKTGLITFSDKIGTQLPAIRNNGQIKRIQESLYNQQTQFKEADFELLYQSIRRSVSSRSLLVLFTNFQTEFALKRAIPIFEKINKKHLLVVVFFENTDLAEYAYQPLRQQSDVYVAAVAEQMIHLKTRMMFDLKQRGIQSILTNTEQLSIQTINKYLEVKAKGII
ncbi:MAG: DUF58 domain-containing protein [Bacteroidota bacterium]